MQGKDSKKLNKEGITVYDTNVLISLFKEATCQQLIQQKGEKVEHTLCLECQRSSGLKKG
jgi:hypothetical protein